MESMTVLRAARTLVCSAPLFQKILAKLLSEQNLMLELEEWSPRSNQPCGPWSMAPPLSSATGWDTTRFGRLLMGKRLEHFSLRQLQMPLRLTSWPRMVNRIPFSLLRWIFFGFINVQIRKNYCFRPQFFDQGSWNLRIPYGSHGYIKMGIIEHMFLFCFTCKICN